MRDHLQEAEKVERVIVREEVTEREKSLSGVAHSAGVTNYALFQSAGYRGLYNKNIGQLKAMRNIQSGSLLDFMGKEELAANLFRITQTELKIKQENIKGQVRLEVASEQVGKSVRRTMIEISGIAPEQLPVNQDINNVKKELKATNKEMKKIDKKQK